MQPRPSTVAVKQWAADTKASCKAGASKAKAGCVSMLRKPDAEGEEQERPRATHTAPNWFQRLVLRQQPRWAWGRKGSSEVLWQWETWMVRGVGERCVRLAYVAPHTH